MTNRYADYDPFAWLYNRHWGTTFMSTALTVLNELLLPRLAPGARILDLCCGTGQLAHILSTQGYRITGLDGSENMLYFARQNAPGVEFLLDDARSFEVQTRFDGVYSVFDSLNHILSIEEMTAAFRHVIDDLEDEGWFLFDLNLEPGFQSDWNGVYGIVEDDCVCVQRCHYNWETKIATYDSTLFRLEDQWRRSDFTLLQRSYAEGEVLAALEAVGFTDAFAYGYNKERGLTKLWPSAPRAFFICRRPGVSKSKEEGNAGNSERQEDR
jgi:SAM-dependent methyltransferase